MWFLQMIGGGAAFAFGAVIGGTVGLTLARYTTKAGRDEIRAENEEFRRQTAAHFSKQHDALIRIAETIATRQK